MAEVMTLALKAFVACVALVSMQQRLSAQDATATSSADAIVNPKAVIELFTSQGCSSCPAADALLGKIAAERQDVVALTLATDTWDYLGWKDTLSNPKFTARQKAYAKVFKDMIYTPQVVINGVAHVNGGDEASIKRKIEAAQPIKVPIRIWGDGGKLHIVAGAANVQGSRDGTLWLVVLSKTATVPIKRGENSGRTLTYYNVVRDVTPVGMWTGAQMAVQFERASIMRADTDSCAVLLQEGQGGPIIGAAMLRSF